jgi:glycosyltransferase involved in cell wall biosynthesis
MMKVIIKGPILSRSGYGEHARLVFRALSSRPDKFDVYVAPIEWGMSNWPLDVNDKETDRIFQCMNKIANFSGEFDLSLQVTVPTEWENLAKCNIGVTAGIETDKASPEWVAATKNVDRIIVVSNHAKTTLAGSKYQHQLDTGEVQWLTCDKEIDVIPYPAKQFEEKEIDLNLETDFNFLTVGQISPRKNVGDLVKWFIKEFKNEEVGLVVKLHTNNNSQIDYAQTLRKVKSWSKLEDKKCKVYLVHGNMSDEEMHALYTHPKIKAFVSTTHGEGYGLPLFEAAYAGLPVVAPAWSGHVDFLYAPVENEKSKRLKNTPLFTKIKYTLKEIDSVAVWEGVLNPDTKWCFPERESYAKCLRNVMEAYTSKKKDANHLKEHILENFSKEKIYKQYTDVALAFESETDKEIEDLFSQLSIE